MSFPLRVRVAFMVMRRSSKAASANRIIVGDCIAALKKLPDASVDLVFADPLTISSSPVT